MLRPPSPLPQNLHACTLYPFQPAFAHLSSAAQDYDERNFLIMPGSVHYADMIKYKVAERRKRLQRGLPVRAQRANPSKGQGRIRKPGYQRLCRAQSMGSRV